MTGFVAALDPNDKYGPRGVEDARYVNGERLRPYQVVFENKPDATAPAQEVVVTDRLDLDSFDLETFSFGPINFGVTFVDPPPGLTQYSADVDLRPDNRLIVRINASLDKATGVVTWRFTSLDPATGLPTDEPLAGFLPPNKTSPEGEGGVLYTVSPKADLPTGTELRNRASIVFDANDPIDTPEWVNTIDDTPPDSEVQPLPETQRFASFEVSWTGQDSGAGLESYTIFVSEDGAPHTMWQPNTTATSATFNGEPGKTYSFYSIAHDAVGNLEVTPAAPDATTTVLADTTSPTTTATLAPAPNAAGWNNTAVTVMLTAVDDADGSGTAATDYAVDTPTCAPSSPGDCQTYSGPFTVTTEGTHSVTFFSTDKAGNAETPNTLPVFLDQTPPGIAASRTPPANPEGWNNSDVTVAWTCTDALSGPSEPNVSETVSGEGDGQSVTGTCSDTAGNTASDTQTGINIDKTAPTTTATTDPAPNPAGWHRGAVTVALAGTDALSGVARIEYRLDGGDWTPYVTPIAVVADGVHTVAYRSIDRAGNQETGDLVSVQVDATPPEISIQFDPSTRDIVVIGSDTGSGVPTGALTPASATTTTAPDDDDDRPRRDERIYHVADAAGNTLTLVVEVRKQGAGRHRVVARVVSLQYNDGALITPPRNKARFDVHPARAGDGTATTVRQRLWVATPQRQLVTASYASRDDKTKIHVVWPRPERREVKPGFVPLRLISAAGSLVVVAF